MDPADLLLIAHQLAIGVVGNRRGRPRQAELRRAVSTAYYAMFHTLARCGADLVAGSTKQHRSQLAWQQAYRALDHGETRKRCTQKTRLAEFPNEIQDFAAAFVRLQRLRHWADYDPLSMFYRSLVLQWIEEVDNSISDFNSVARADRKAFAVYVLLKHRSD